MFVVGKLKRDNLEANEESLLMAALKTMNLAKLVSSDVPLFLSLLSDVFPGREMPPKSGDKPLAAAIERAALREHVGSG